MSVRSAIHSLVGASLVILLLSAPAANASNVGWVVTKDHWSEADEKGWQDFITALGSADCWSIDACLKDPANPYRATDPKGVRFMVDCADTPYVLRAYFAWKNGLPFSWQTAMQSADGPGADIRYSPNGNRVVGRKNLPATVTGINALSILRELSGTISSAMYRRSALSDSDTYFTDLYSPRLDRKSIKPGTVVYDVNGHVSMVWRVELGGRIMIFSSHPDNTMSRSFLGREFLRTKPELGSIFQNWRPLRLEGARQLPNGVLVGGHVTAPRNSEIDDFSLEQYVGNPPTDPHNWGQAKFVYDDEEMDFYTYVRARVSFGELEYHPVEEMHSMMQTLCNDIRTRKQAIEISLRQGTHDMSPPAKLSDNIYGTDGVWELYSTPSRDARLKTAFKEMYDQTRDFVSMKEMDQPRLSYSGQNLPQDLLDAYDQESAACTTNYTASDGRTIALTIDDVAHRLFKLSFDPYQCVERRWGATEPAELSSCSDGDEKSAWYDAEQNLRNQIDRTYDVFMGNSRAELLQGPFGMRSGKGVEVAPTVDIKAWLQEKIAMPQAVAPQAIEPPPAPIN
jgi:hypothetical protein